MVMAVFSFQRYTCLLASKDKKKWSLLQVTTRFIVRMLSLEGEVVTYAYHVVVGSVSVVEQTTKAVTNVHTLPNIQTHGEVKRKAVYVVTILEVCTITQVQSSECLQVGTERGREATNTCLNGDFVVCALVSPIVGILKTQHIDSEILVEVVLCAATQFQLGSNANFTSIRKSLLGSLSHQRCCTQQHCYYHR